MSQGFYEMLGVKPDASAADVRQAFQARLAALVRRLKAARKQGADVSLLETQERAIREAMEVLSDPARRRRYDAFREILDQDTTPTDASSLWDQCRGSLMDPATVAALNVVRALTALPVGEPVPGLPPRQHLRNTSPAPAAPAPQPTPQPAPQLGAQSGSQSGSQSGAQLGSGARSAPPALHMPPPSVASIPLHPSVLTPPQAAPPTARVPVPRAPAQGLQGAVSGVGGSDHGPALQEGSGHGISAHPASISGHGMGGGPRFAPIPEPEDISDVDMLIRRYGYDGRFLRAVRESQGMSLEALSRATRISLRYLEALEGNAFDRLPSRVFVRGYVREVARELDIDDTEVVEQYVALFEHHGG